jgi:hypothetical protein
LQLRQGDSGLAEADFREAISLAQKMTHKPGNCALPPASRVCCATTIGVMKRTRCSRMGCGRVLRSPGS